MRHPGETETAIAVCIDRCRVRQMRHVGVAAERHLLVPVGCAQSVAAGAHAIALAGNVALTLWPGPGVSVLALTLVGLGYGLVSGLTAAAVAVYWRRALYGRMASRIYLAWCAAAIILPITAGRLFDLTQGYGVAILIAAGGNALGILVALGLPRAKAPLQSTAAGSTVPAKPIADG